MKKRLLLTLISNLILTTFVLVSCSDEDVWKLGFIENNPLANPTLVQDIQNNRSDNVKYEKNSDGYIDLRSTKVDSSYLDEITLTDLNNFTTFDTLTEWPEALPEGFEPEKLIEEGKERKLNLDQVHEKGYDGTGVGIAIIDQTLLVDHVEIKDNLKFYKSSRNDKEPASMHGVAMASIAVGKNVGVAPNADLYFVVDDSYNFELNERDVTHTAEDILNIIELNKSLDNKIRVISISSGYMDKDYPTAKKTKGADEMKEAIKKANESGIVVLCITPGNEIMRFVSLTSLSNENVDDFNNYKPSYDTLNPDNLLFVPTDKMTHASFTGENEYTYASIGGASSIVPYVAGLYAIACQVDSSITFEEFVQIADETAYEKDYISKEYGNQKIKIVNPNAIFEELIK